MSLTNLTCEMARLRDRHDAVQVQPRRVVAPHRFTKYRVAILETLSPNDGFLLDDTS